MIYYLFRYEKPIAKIHDEDCTFVPKDSQLSQLEYAFLEEICNYWSCASDSKQFKELQEKSVKALHRRNGPYTLIPEESYKKGWWEALREVRNV